MKPHQKSKFKIGVIALTFALLLSTVVLNYGANPKQDYAGINLNSLSESLLKDIREGKNTDALQEQIAHIPVETLENALQTDTQKMAFWINIYNAYIQIILSKHPDLYDDRNAFFKADQVPIANRKIPFSLIEHGILRKSQWELGGGYVRKWFTSDFERKLRVREQDYRIHFALNCGAKDCPPVAIYEPGRLEGQLHKGTQLFLSNSTTLDKATKTVEVTSLFSWFRGDFGGKNGTLKILEDFHVVEPGAADKLRFKNYDWTLSLHNFIDL